MLYCQYFARKTGKLASADAPDTGSCHGIGSEPEYSNGMQIQELQRRGLAAKARRLGRKTSGCSTIFQPVYFITISRKAPAHLAPHPPSCG